MSPEYMLFCFSKLFLMGGKELTGAPLYTVGHTKPIVTAISLTGTVDYRQEFLTLLCQSLQPRLRYHPENHSNLLENYQKELEGKKKEEIKSELLVGQVTAALC